MTSSHPSLLRLRLLSVRPRLLLTEIQLVDSSLLYRRLDRRDHVPIEVRVMPPGSADWADLRLALNAASFWSWPRRWPRAPDERRWNDLPGVRASRWGLRVGSSSARGCNCDLGAHEPSYHVEDGIDLGRHADRPAAHLRRARSTRWRSRTRPHSQRPGSGGFTMNSINQEGARRYVYCGTEFAPVQHRHTAHPPH